jgi:general stress protein CsbA
VIGREYAIAARSGVVTAVVTLAMAGADATRYDSRVWEVGFDRASLAAAGVLLDESGSSRIGGRLRRA